MSGKVFEAKEHCKAAEKAMKTNVFRWKPDYDSAADEYSQAAQCYRIARDLPNSKECHLKASECFKKNHAFFHAAKSLENAMIVFKESTPPEEIYNLAMESSSLFQQHGSGDSGASVLDKAAKFIEPTAPELAVKLFQQAADVSSRAGEGEAPMDIDDSDNAEVCYESDSGDSDLETLYGLEYYRNKVPRVTMEYYRSKVPKEAMEYLISELGEDPFAPGVLEKHAVSGKVGVENTEPGSSVVTLTKVEQAVKAHNTFFNVCMEMGAYYFQDPEDNDEVKDATRKMILFMMGYYQTIVERNTSLYNGKRITKYARMIRQEKREIKMMRKALDAVMEHFTTPLVLN